MTHRTTMVLVSVDMAIKLASVIPATARTFVAERQLVVRSALEMDHHGVTSRPV